jgi:ribosomal-protein-alanine N-acetyltransferase
MTTATLTAPAGRLLDQPAAPTVDLQPLRPIHAIELSGLTLAIDEIARGSDLTRYVRTRRWVLRRLARPAVADRRTYVVRHAGRLVGLALLDNLRRGRVCAAELTVLVAPDAAGEVAGRAARAAVGLASSLGLHRLEVAVLPDDEAGLACYAAAGFTAVGLARGYRLVGGHWHDHVLLERLTEPG